MTVALLGATVVLLIALLVVALKLFKSLRGATLASHKEPAARGQVATAEPEWRRAQRELHGEKKTTTIAEPFEADGRWWYQRGEELLVYDAGTGEWIPVSTEDPPDRVEVAAAREPTVAAETTWEPTVVAPAHEDPADGTFWKCPSCGAVNGSVSATCRMCFAARP